VLIVSSGSTDNVVQGNYIGTNAAGTAKIGNKWYGVEVSRERNLIGGTTSGARNVISGSGYAGVVLYLSTGVNNRVEGNYIGTDYTGTKDLGNTGAGVDITNGAKNNIVGGSSSAARNIICGNDLFGVGIYNNSDNNRVENNYIGLTASGKTLLNSKSAVLVSDGSGGNAIRNNCIACCTGYKIIHFVSGGNSSTSNSLFEQVTSGVDLM
jgi:titin